MTHFHTVQLLIVTCIFISCNRAGTVFLGLYVIDVKTELEI